ncbi:MAG: acyltransferase, partial [bacterium]|nr:acyltransferase [bacterium]
MRTSEVVNTLMFDYPTLDEREIAEHARTLTPKLLRWIGAHHPDNRTRKVFFRLTGVAIGSGTVINGNFLVSDNYNPLLTIGNRVSIAANVTIICVSAPNNSNLASMPHVADNLICERPVRVGDDAWIGVNAVVLPGVDVGAGSIVGAGAVVT